MDIEKENPRWNAMWSNGINPGEAFDKGHVSPLLESYIKEFKIPIGRALVPGCGRGYDVTALASPQRTVLGLDISDIAIESAKLRLMSLNDEDCYKDGISFSTASFFDVEGLFDFIYDYTFLCALHPSVRKLWAEKMSDLLQKGGELLTLIYPIIDGDHESGPPYKVSLELLKELLFPVGFECIELAILPTELCHDGRDGTGPFAAKSGVGRWRKI